MARRMTLEEFAVWRKLASQIDEHLHWNRIRLGYANAQHDAQARGVPSSLQVPLDWPRKTIEVLSAKLLPLPFTVSGSSTLGEDLTAVYAGSGVAFAERQAIDAALLHGPAFVFTSSGDVDAGDPEVVVSVRSALQATADVDPRTRRVVSAIEVLDDGEANLWLPGRTLHLSGFGDPEVVEEYPAPKRVRCAVYTHDSTLDKPFGRSRITPTIIRLTDAAMRTLMRQELSAEFYQSPRPLFFGLSSEDLVDDGGKTLLENLIGGVWGIPDASDQDESADSLRRAKAEWAPQMSMQPFSDQFRLIAGALAGAASIPLQHLGVVQDSNPTSAEAIMAQEAPLVEVAGMRQTELDWARRQLALDILTTLHGDLDAAAMTELRSLACRWVDARHRSVSEQSQFVQLQVQAGNMTAGAESTLRQLPISEDDVQAILADNKAAAAQNALATLTQAAANASPDASALALKSDSGSAGAGQNSADDLKAKFDALGVAIRAGVSPESAAAQLGLTGIDFTGAVPVSLRLPEADTTTLEQK